MKRLLVMSDSHMREDKLELAAKQCEAESYDYIVHLGDCVRDARWLERRLGRKVLKVMGNCDGYPSDAGEIALNIEGVKTLMCHGHEQNVKFGRGALSYYAEDRHCALALYGHTHNALVETLGNVICVCPGALKNGEMAVVEIDSGCVSPVLFRI